VTWCSSICPRSAPRSTRAPLSRSRIDEVGVGDLRAVGGTVSAVNESLRGAPESVNADPYGEGWICEITTTSGADFDALLDAEGYAALTNN